MSQPKQPAVTTQIQKTELPAWVDAASQKNYALAEEIGARPYEAYDGQRVAELSAGEQAAPGILAGGMTRGNSALDASSAMATAAGGFRPTNIADPTGVADVTAGGFLSRDINGYMSPFVNNVVDTTMTGMRDNLELSAVKNNDAARAAGAFGGSRHGVTEGVLRAEGAKGMAATEAGLRSAAFTDAANRITTDNQTALQAALANQNSALTTQGQKIQVGSANQNAGIAGAQLGLTGAGILNQNAQTASDTAGRNALLSSQLGQQDRAVEQAKLDQEYASFMEQRNYPLEQLNTQLAALGMSPYGKTTSSTGTSQSSNSSNGLMTAIGAGATLLPLLFSDRKTKKNIKRLPGKGPNDLNLYEFDYKKEFGGAEGNVGFMSDDVRKKVPGAVHKVKVGKKKIDAVDYGKAAGFMGRAA